MALTAEEIKAITEQSLPYTPGQTTPATPGATGAMTMEPTGQEKLEAMLLGGAQGAVKGTGVMGGAMAGMRLGAAAAPFAGAAAPVVPVLGTIGGAALGMLGTEELDKILFDDKIAAQRPEVAPYREGGKTFGETIASAPWLFALPTFTGNRVSRFISDIGTTARKNPYTFLAGEVPAATYSGIAGGSAYALDPEAKGTRLIAEISAGLLSPTRLLSQAVGTAMDWGSRFKGVTSGAGRQLMAENSAAQQLQQILQDHGEDIPKLIRMLEKPLPASVPTPTSAQKTGNLVLSEIEKALSNLHVKFGADTQAQGNDALRAYTLLVQRLRDVGTPDALTQSAQLRSNLFDQMLNARLATADANAARKILKITQDTPQARAEIGEIVKAETSFALQNARDVEKMLWDEALRQITAPITKTTAEMVPMEGRKAEKLFKETGSWPMVQGTFSKVEMPKVVASNAFENYLQRVSQIGDAAYEKVVPAVVRDIMQDLGVMRSTVLVYKDAKKTPQFLETGKVVLPPAYKPKEVDVGELINYRSDLLGLARDAAARGEGSDASLYSNLADAILTDLNQLKSPAFDAARDFSRSLNDVFTRTFAKSATVQGDVARTGAERLPAEILVSRAFGRNADVTAQRMNEIEDAVKFMRTQYDKAVAQFGPKSDQALLLKPHADMADQAVISIQDAQSRILRLLAAKTVDPITGRVNPTQLQTFVNENKGMLDKMGMTADLTDIVKAELALKNVANQNSQLNRNLRNQTTFAQVLKAGENPTNAVLDVLTSNKPVLGMNRLMQLAQSGGQGAVEGLKSTLFDYAFTKAGGVDKFDPAAFRDALFAPLGPNKPSIINLMRQHGMMDFGDVRGINELLKPMMRIEDAIANKQSLDQIVNQAGAVTDLALRILGSKIGSTAAGGGGPGTLIAASAGSKAMRTIFDKMPTAMARAAMEDAMRDPALLSLMLQKPTSAKQNYDLSRAITTRLVSSGVLPASMINYVENQPPSMQPSAAEMLKKVPAAPPTRGFPVLPQSKPPAGQASPAAGKVSMAPGEQDMYQALFPQDTISSLMAMQQPSQG